MKKIIAISIMNNQGVLELSRDNYKWFFLAEKSCTHLKELVMSLFLKDTEIGEKQEAKPTSEKEDFKKGQKLAEGELTIVDGVSHELTSKKDTYFVDEPFRLTLRVKNVRGEDKVY